jgi:hypothetical protein
MPWGYAAAAVGTYLTTKSQKDASSSAAAAQTQSAQLGIEEQRRQFDAIQKLLAPYVSAGTGAITGQQDLLGLSGAPAQQQAIQALQASPQFGALTQQGENAILANASATGGLRGGNVQGTLAQFRPQLLSQLIDQQYQRLGGLTSLGQNAAAGVGNAGLQTGNAVTQLLGQQGQAQAGAALAKGQANSQLISGLTNILGNYMGSKF